MKFELGSSARVETWMWQGCRLDEGLVLASAKVQTINP
jgi:hypothetical protein